MRVLGIDPGLNITGYGLLDDGQKAITVLEAGVVRTKAAEPTHGCGGGLVVLVFGPVRRD